MRMGFDYSKRIGILICGSKLFVFLAAAAKELRLGDLRKCQEKESKREEERRG